MSATDDLSGQYNPSRKPRKAKDHDDKVQGIRYRHPDEGEPLGFPRKSETVEEILAEMTERNFGSADRISDEDFFSVNFGAGEPETEFHLQQNGSEAPWITYPMILHCPLCNERHIDEDEFSHRAHHTHACQNCGHVWRPAKINTHGVQFLPGFKNGDDQCPATTSPSFQTAFTAARRSRS